MCSKERPPIHDASQQRLVDAVTHLLQHGADPKDIHQQFLPFLVFDKHFELARSLIQREAPIFGIIEPERQNLLHLLCITPELSGDDRLSSILLVCSHSNRPELITMLQQKDATRRTPIHYALEHCNLAVINILLKFDIWDNMADFLVNAEKHKRSDAIHLYLDRMMAMCRKPEPTAPICIEMHLCLTLRCLLERGEFVDILGGENNSPALYEAYHDANINYFNKPGLVVTSKKDYPLHVACTKGSISVVPILLAVGADYFVLDHRHRSSLHLATMGFNTSVIQQIVERGVDLEIHDDHGRSAYHYACDRRNREAISLLIELGAEII